MSHDHDSGAQRDSRAPHKSSGSLLPVSFGEDVDFVVGVTAAALTGDQLLKATQSRHGVSHLLKAGMGAAVAAGAFTLLKREHDEKKNEEERKHHHHHEHRHHDHHHEHHQDSRSGWEDSRSSRARGAGDRDPSPDPVSRRQIQDNGVPLGRQISYERRRNDSSDAVPAERRRHSTDGDDSGSVEDESPDPATYRRGRSYSPHPRVRRLQ